MPNQRLFACAVALSLVASSQAVRADDRKHDDGDRQQKPLKCDDLNAFRPDSLTTVLLVKAFKKGDLLTLSTTPPPPPPAPPAPASNVNDVWLPPAQPPPPAT